MAVLRWVTRVFALVIAGILILLFFGEGPPIPAALSTREKVLFTFFGITWLGLLAGWKWETVGGTMVVGGMVGFYIAQFLFTSTVPRGPYFLIITLPGWFFLVCSLVERRADGSKTKWKKTFPVRH